MVEATSGSFIRHHGEGSFWRKLIWWIIPVGLGALMVGFFGGMGGDLWSHVKSAIPRENTALPDTQLSEGLPSGESMVPGRPLVMRQARTEETSSEVDENTDLSCSKQLLYTKSISTSHTRSITIKEMVSKLLSSSAEADAHCGHRLANSVPISSIRSDVLVSVSDKYVDLMKCERAIKAAQDIPVSSIRDTQLNRILVHRSCSKAVYVSP